MPMSSLPSPHILVVDDDSKLRDLLTSYLDTNGFSVSSASGGPAMWAALAQTPADAIVLDLMLPGEDGLALTRALRAKSSVPILMLSARGEEIDRVVGLEMGADDYLTKPFSPRELVARLRALLRRSQTFVAEAPISEVQRFGPFVLDPQSHRLFRDDQEVALTSADYELLIVLVAQPNRVLSRDTLFDLMRGYERDAFDRSIDNRVARLRRKIESDPATPAYIRTVRSEGYLFNPKGDQP
jgi:two-component system phosphate regulon response regulator OmpR